MTHSLIPYLLTCGPFVLMLAAWIRLFWTRQWPRPIALIALGIASANATFAAHTFLYYHLKPSPWLPPWQDPEVLNLALLFFLAPISIVVGLIAGGRGAPKWLVWAVQIASVPLFLIGILACVAV
jgi:hypothetical protein